MVSAGITEEELSKVRGQLAGSTVLGSEDSGSRMSRLGRAELDSGKFTSTDELLEKNSWRLPLTMCTPCQVSGGAADDHYDCALTPFIIPENPAARRRSRV